MVDGRIRQCPADGTRAPDIERSAIVQVIIICGNEQCSIRSCRIGERIKQVSGAEMFARPSCVPGHTCQVGHQKDRFPDLTPRRAGQVLISFVPVFNACAFATVPAHSRATARTRARPRCDGPPAVQCSTRFWCAAIHAAKRREPVRCPNADVQG